MKTKEGYEVVHLLQDETGDTHAIIKRVKDYAVCCGYDVLLGAWRQGIYCLKTDIDAIIALNEYYDGTHTFHSVEAK